MTVRPRTDSDLAACVRLARIVLEHDGYPPRRADDLDAFIATAGGLGAWVATEAHEVVAHVALNARSSLEVMAQARDATGIPDDRLAVVARLLVAPSARRAGVATALLTTASDAARAHGCRPILDVATHFTAAVELYEQCGWTRIGVVTVAVPGDEPLDEYVYVAPAC